MKGAGRSSESCVFFYLIHSSPFFSFPFSPFSLLFFSYLLQSLGRVGYESLMSGHTFNGKDFIIPLLLRAVEAFPSAPARRDDPVSCFVYCTVYILQCILLVDGGLVCLNL